VAPGSGAVALPLYLPLYLPPLPELFPLPLGLTVMAVLRLVAGLIRSSGSIDFVGVFRILRSVGVFGGIRKSAGSMSRPSIIRDSRGPFRGSTSVWCGCFAAALR
jgi:hypothetical protein